MKKVYYVKANSYQDAIKKVKKIKSKQKDAKECTICGKIISGKSYDAEPLGQGVCCEDCYNNYVKPSKLGRDAYDKPIKKKSKKKDGVYMSPQSKDTLSDIQTKIHTLLDALDEYTPRSEQEQDDLLAGREALNKAVEYIDKAVYNLEDEINGKESTESI